MMFHGSMLFVTRRSASTHGIVGETAVDFGVARRVDHQQHADAPAFAPGERSGEEDEAVVPEGVHEGGMVVRTGLRDVIAPAGPGCGRLHENDR
jgi:hypothetical protein